ncbi:hypothetical protein VPH35_096890 [Triticum aestivum]
MEQLKLGSLQALEVDWVSSPPSWSLVRLRRWMWCPPPPTPTHTPPVEPCQGSDNLPLGVVERGVLDVAALPSSVTVGQVMPVSGMTIEPLVLAPTSNPNALFTKELCDFLASVEVA